MVNVREYIVVVTCGMKGMRFSDVRERFSRRFHKPGATNITIRKLANEFRRTGSVHEENRC